MVFGANLVETLQNVDRARSLRWQKRKHVENDSSQLCVAANDLGGGVDRRQSDEFPDDKRSRSLFVDGDKLLSSAQLIHCGTKCPDLVGEQLLDGDLGPITQTSRNIWCNIFLITRDLFVGTNKQMLQNNSPTLVEPMSHFVVPSSMKTYRQNKNILWTNITVNDTSST